MIRRSPLLRFPVAYFTRILYINPRQQTLIVMLSGVVLIFCVASGALLFGFSDPRDLMERGKWLMKQGKSAEAVDILETLVHTQPDNFEAHLALANAYMEIEARDQANFEFKEASKLKSGNPSDSSAHLAIARMFIQDHNFHDAEKQLFQAVQANPKSKTRTDYQDVVKNLYMAWGDSFLDKTPPDYEQAYKTYLKGLRKITHKKLQPELATKFARASERLANTYGINKQYDRAIATLKQGFRYEPSTNMLLAIGALYEQKQDVDEAIVWYSKLYEVEPDTIKDKLVSLLTEKGQEMSRYHQNEKAKQYFEAAKRINPSLQVPPNILFPIEVLNVSMDSKLSKGNHHLDTAVAFELKNMSLSAVPFMEIKTIFMAGDATLGEVNQILRSQSGYALNRYGEPGSIKTVHVEFDKDVNPKDLKPPRVMATIYVNYHDDEEKDWIRIQSKELALGGVKAPAERDTASTSAARRNVPEPNRGSDPVAPVQTPVAAPEPAAPPAVTPEAPAPQ